MEEEETKNKKTEKKLRGKKEHGNYCELTPKTNARISIEQERKMGTNDTRRLAGL